MKMPKTKNRNTENRCYFCRKEALPKQCSVCNKKICENHFAVYHIPGWKCCPATLGVICSHNSKNSCTDNFRTVNCAKCREYALRNIDSSIIEYPHLYHCSM